MSDFRFKISGDTSPFLAELYNATTSSKVASKVIEYSGISTLYTENYTCVIFGGLDDNTSYYAKITDNIGNTLSTVSQPVTTPIDPIILPTEITVNLLGDYENLDDANSNCSYEYIISPKCIDISPAPQASQCVCIPLNFITEETANEEAYINIYKCTSSTSFTKIDTVQQETCTKTVKIGQGEAICYEVYTALNTEIAGEKSACAKMSFAPSNVDVSGYGGYDVNSATNSIDISQNLITTTAPPQPSLPDVTVYLTDPSYDVNTNIRQKKTSFLATKPGLSAGQSFKLNYEIINHYDIEGVLPSITCMRGDVRDPDTPERYATYDKLETTVRRGTDTVSEPNSIDVNSDNIAGTDFISLVDSPSDNSNYNHIIRQCIRFTGISNQQGANFQYGTTGYNSAISTELESTTTNTTIDTSSGDNDGGSTDTEEPALR